MRKYVSSGLLNAVDIGCVGVCAYANRTITNDNECEIKNGNEANIIEDFGWWTLTTTASVPMMCFIPFLLFVCWYFIFICASGCSLFSSYQSGVSIYIFCI